MASKAAEIAMPICRSLRSIVGADRLIACRRNRDRRAAFHAAIRARARDCRAR
jgi:hypothetical protein